MDGVPTWAACLITVVVFGPSLLCLACAVDAARRPPHQWSSIGESRRLTVSLMSGSALFGTLSIFAVAWYLVYQRRKLIGQAR